MKKLLLLLIVSSFSSFSQSWQWTKTSPLSSWYRNPNHGLVTAAGKIYEFSSYGSNNPADTAGTKLIIYSTSGSVLSQKQWRMPFHITRMQHYNGHLYFTATFWGTVNIDGHSLVSMGQSDGAMGSMDLNGTLEWVHTFGGPGVDCAEALTVSKNFNTLYAGGSIHDTLAFDNAYYSTEIQSALLVKYDLLGQRLLHKLYAFTPVQNHYTNVIVSMDQDPAGNITMLMDRDGEMWLEWPQTMPAAGRYLTKLNQQLDTVWTKFIISNGCYYGWSCSDVKVSANGDAYVSPTCDGKYGNDCSLKRYDKTTGAEKWSLPNNDGAYPEFFIDSTTVILIGNEGANGCPCEGSTPGYQVIKIYDETNALKGEARVEGPSFFCMAIDASDIYISGYIGGQADHPVQFGPDTLRCKPGATNFISRLSRTTCTVPQIVYTPPRYPYMPEFTLCPGQSAHLSVAQGPGTYSWTNGATGTNTDVFQNGFYCAVNTQPNGCVAYSLPVEVFVNEKALANRPMFVTYDTATNHNTLIAVSWSDDNEYDQANARLLRQYNGQLQEVYRLSYSNPGVFAFIALRDSLSDPSSEEVVYYLQKEDSCGNISAPANPINSIFLTVTNSTQQNILSWNRYWGHKGHYLVYRGVNAKQLSLLATLDTSAVLYTDVNPPAGDLYYQLAAETNSITVGNRTYKNAKSNIVRTGGTTIVNVAQVIAGVTLHPNPAKNELVLSLGESLDEALQVKVMNALGQQVYTGTWKSNQEHSIDVQSYQAGVYFIELTTGNNKMRRKFIKE